MGSERNYHVKTLSKHKLTFATTPTHLKLVSVYARRPAHKGERWGLFKNFSTMSTFTHAPRGERIGVSDVLNPWFITGFSDAESSFFISIYRDEKSKLKWRVTPSFSINIHIKDIELLESIKNTLGVGKVRKNSKTGLNSHSTAVFRVDNIQEMDIIIKHFIKYPLISAKLSDFLLFKECFDLIKKKEHLTQSGLEKIVSLRCNLNKGLTEELLNSFPNIIPVERPKYSFKKIPDPHWVSGFASGDSSFSVSIEKSQNKVGSRIRLIFGTCLHIRDKGLLIGIAQYLSVLPELEVNKYIYDSKPGLENSLLQIKKFSDIEEKIIPFFEKYPVLGVKRLDFLDFKKITEIVKSKNHLSTEGLNEIKKITEGMNLRRRLF